MAALLNSSFLSHPARDTFPSQPPLPPAALGQGSALEIAALPRMLSSFQLLWECQGSCRDVMGWKEAKHHLEEMISSLSASVATGNSSPTTQHWGFLVFSSIASIKARLSPKGDTILCCQDVVASSGTRSPSLGASGTHLCWAAAPPSQAGWQRRGSWSCVLEGERGSRTQKLGVLMFFPQKPFPSGFILFFFFFQKRPHRDLLASVFLAVTFRPISSVQQIRQEKTNRIGHHQTQQNPATEETHPHKAPAAAGRQKPLEPWRKSHWGRHSPSRQTFRRSSEKTAPA